MRFHNDPPTHLSLTGLDAIPVRHAFTTRHHPSVTATLGLGATPSAAGAPALEALGVTGTAIRFARQVHGTSWLVADGLSSGLVGTGDAMITSDPGCPLAVFTADCLAVILTEPERPILAVAHVGWRGTVAGLLGGLVPALVTRFGARPDRLKAAIGPSIGPCCYEVDEPVVRPLRSAFPDDWARWVRPGGEGKWWLDLWQANSDQLTAAGVRPDAICNPRLCTVCRRDLFFSYRAEGPGAQQAALALLA